MSSVEFDVCVVGAGPGGYVAALRAAANGARTALIEKRHLGGTCLNVGCIPTKTLLAGAELYHKAKTRGAEFGVKGAAALEADWGAMLARKNDVVRKLSAGIGGLLKAAGVELFMGQGSFTGPCALAVTGGPGPDASVSAKSIIVATGSKPAMPGFIPRSPRVLDSTAILDIPEVPRSLLILGGGVIGCEFACLFACLGAKVTIVEMLPDILANMDREAVKAASREFKALGIDIRVGAPLKDIAAGDASVSGSVNGERLEADCMLVAVGRVPALDGLNPAAAGLSPDEKGFLRVDARCRAAPGVYAVGDVTGRVQLAHVASAMALRAADDACGIRGAFDDSLVPSCVYTFPEIASVGLTQEQCEERKLDVRIGKFPFSSLGKAMAAGEGGGFCKVIADAGTDQILGVHIVGAHATDLISEAVAAMSMEATAASLGKAIHPHPTMSEAIMEAAHDAHGVSVHTPARKRKH